MNTFVQNVATGKTYNGALTHETSLNANLDFFALAGSMRFSEEIFDLWEKAYNENPLSAVRLMFWLRDVRGGAKERDSFRKLFVKLADTSQEIAIKVIEFIPEYGYWKDLVLLMYDNSLNPVVKVAIFNTLVNQFQADIRAAKPSLLAKYMPNESKKGNTDYAVAQRNLAKMLIKRLDYTPRQYRKALTSLRAKLDVVEVKMADKQWDEINYSGVPSRAASNYRNAFKRHDQERYTQFVEDAVTGKVSIKSGTLQPHELLARAGDKTTQAQWNQLPDWLTDSSAILPVVDSSGSMTRFNYYGGNRQLKFAPADVADALAIYVAERNKSAFKDLVINFSDYAEFIRLSGSLEQKRNILRHAKWEYNTNIQSVFNLVLGHAVKHNVPQKDMPKFIVILSDMQFDEGVAGYTNHQVAKQKFAQAGYDLPIIVYWNLAAPKVETAVTKDEANTMLISGFDPAIFKYILQGKMDKLTPPTPLDVMLAVVNSERYSPIVL